MSVSRRDFLKYSGISVGGLLATGELPTGKLVRQEQDSNSVLYDATICVGCKACQVACKRRVDRPLPPVTDPTNTWEMPRDLSANVWTLIKLYESEDKKTWSYVKQQCMHCIEPACVSVCPVGALQKLPSGPVVYEDWKCFGCRYCMAACPFRIPRYQWDKVLPLIQKCDFCSARQAEGKVTACVEACPTGALKFGKRSEILAEAKQRIADTPGRYENRVFGETEVGGTAWLYLSKAGVPFEKLGFPKMDSTALPELDWPFLLAVPGIIVVVGGLMSAIYARTHRGTKAKEA